MQSALTISADLAQAKFARDQQLAEHLDRAQAYYQQRQWNQAIHECDEALALDPSNKQAAALKSQVQQTMSILGNP